MKIRKHGLFHTAVLYHTSCVPCDGRGIERERFHNGALDYLVICAWKKR
jgi:hypothetical protein